MPLDEKGKKSKKRALLLIMQGLDKGDKKAAPNLAAIMEKKKKKGK